MYELFFQKLREKANFNDDELLAIQNYLTPKKLRKKQYLLQVLLITTYFLLSVYSVQRVACSAYQRQQATYHANRLVF